MDYYSYREGSHYGCLDHFRFGCDDHYSKRLPWSFLIWFPVYDCGCATSAVLTTLCFCLGTCFTFCLKITAVLSRVAGASLLAFSSAGADFATGTLSTLRGATFSLLGVGVLEFSLLPGLAVSPFKLEVIRLSAVTDENDTARKTKFLSFHPATTAFYTASLRFHIIVSDTWCPPIPLVHKVSFSLKIQHQLHNRFLGFTNKPYEIPKCDLKNTCKETSNIVVTFISRLFSHVTIASLAEKLSITVLIALMTSSSQKQTFLLFVLVPTYLTIFCVVQDLTFLFFFDLGPHSNRFIILSKTSWI